MRLSIFLCSRMQGAHIAPTTFTKRSTKSGQAAPTALYNIVQRIHSYLTCRLQVVIVGGEQSSSLPVIAGVPQGSVLGPLLFFIFINEIATHISADSKISPFADDIALYRSILSDADYSILQSDMSTIVAGINSSLLSLQPAKCCCMLISRKKNKLLPPCVTVEGTPLAFIASMRSTWDWSSIPIYLDPPCGQFVYQSQEAHWSSLPTIQ